VVNRFNVGGAYNLKRIAFSFILNYAFYILHYLRHCVSWIVEATPFAKLNSTLQTPHSKLLYRGLGIMKTTYKILSPILCLASIPVILFLPLIRLVVTSSLSDSIMSTFGIKEYTSLYDILRSVIGANETTTSIFKTIASLFSDGESKLSQIFNTIPWGIAAAVILVVIILCMLAATVLGILGKSGVNTIISGSCVVLTVAMKWCFTKFVEPIASGRLGLKTLLSGSEENVLTQLIGSAAKVECLEMSMIYQGLLLLTACIAILSLFAFMDKKYNI
jgi:hypothetical protein